MRLFVAVVPPEHVRDQVSELGAALRDELGGSGDRDRERLVRWTTREQWHVTLRFLGEVPDPAGAVEALQSLGRPTSSSSPGSTHVYRSDESGHEDGAGGTSADDRDHEGDHSLAPVEAELDPKPTILGRSVLCLPVRGLDELARSVSEATAHIGQPPEPRRFRGHVTIARLRGRRRRSGGFGNLPSPRSGSSTGIRWTVNEVQVVRSHLRDDGSRYEVLSTMPLS